METWFEFVYSEVISCSNMGSSPRLTPSYFQKKARKCKWSSIVKLGCITPVIGFLFQLCPNEISFWNILGIGPFFWFDTPLGWEGLAACHPGFPILISLFFGTFVTATAILNMQLLFYHVFREGNSFSNKLAALGHDCTDFSWWDTLPDSLLGDFLRDCCNLPNFRFS